MSGGSEIEVLVREMESAWNRHDVTAFVDLFAQDAEFTNVEGRRVEGREGIARLHAPGFEGAYRKSRLTMKSARVRLLKPNVATADLEWQLVGTLDSSEKVRPPRRGLMNWVVTRERGKWRIRVSHNLELRVEEM